MSGYAVLDAALQRARFEILYCGRVSHDANWRERDSKATSDIWIVEQGSMRVTYKRKIYTLLPGDVFWLEPDVAYSAVGGPQGCTFLFVHFRASLEEKLNVFADFDLGGKTEGALVIAEVHSFVNAFEDSTAARPMAQFSLKATLMRLCARMVALKETKQTPVTRLEQLLKQIDERMPNAFSVTELATQMQMSEKYFISYFKKHMGQTPYAYMSARRMQHAYAMLHGSDMSVRMVAEQLGYGDAYAFSKAFKAHFGIAPSFVHQNKGKTKKIYH